MNYSSQHPKVKAWSQIRARIRSAWNDLFSSDRPEQDDPSVGSASGFTLRKLFAGVWGIAAIAFTAREYLETVFAVGVPLALLGYAYLSGLRLGCFFQALFWAWLIIGWYFCYQYPRDMAPVSLPDSAHDVRYSGGWGDCQFRFEAPPRDCQDSAQRHTLRYPHWYPKPGLEINRKLGLIPSYCFDVKTKYSWFDIKKIERGWYYEGYSRMWVDSERGIFFYEFHD